MYIFLITILGLALRLININKPEGLWNDEYVSWFVASTPFGNGFWEAVLKQCHMPFYYLYLKPFADCSDIILRLTSVIPSVAAIPVMYLTGKEFSKKTGYLCAGITAILPFLVYYSQEVRFYSLLFLFSALALLFTIRLVKGKKGWYGYIIASLLILATHVLGGIYVFLTLAYIIYKKKKVSSKMIIGIIIAFLCVLPFGLNILKMLPSSQWWGVFSYTNILFLFSDFLSPILTNNVNAPNVFFYSKDLIFTLLMTVPTILGVLGIILGAKQAKGLTIIALGTVFITSILALSGHLVFITKYCIEILPILILLFALGSNGKLGNVILAIFIFFELFAIFTPYYPAKSFRTEGHRLPAEVLNDIDSDKIIFTYYEPNRFFRYLKTDAKTDYISKINRFEYIEKPASILDSVKKGERVSIVFLDSVSFIPESMIEEAKERKIPEMFITFSVIRNGITRELNYNYRDFIIKKKGSWTIITAKRFK